MIGNGARICVNQKEEGYIVSRLRKRLQSLIDLARKAKAALTRRVVGIYLLFTLLAAVIFESLLYLFAPADLPPLIIRLGSIVWGVIVVVLAGGVLALLANKEVRDWLGGLPKFVEASFVTRKVRRVVIISSIVTALLYPLYQVIASPSRTAIPNTSYRGSSMNGTGNNDKPPMALVRTAFS